MLVDIIKEIIASQEDIDVTGEIAGHSGLLKAVAQTQADSSCSAVQSQARTTTIAKITSTSRIDAIRSAAQGDTHGR
jgi:hypothetical protein